jgi:putative redox protein
MRHSITPSCATGTDFHKGWINRGLKKGPEIYTGSHDIPYYCLFVAYTWAIVMEVRAFVRYIGDGLFEGGVEGLETIKLDFRGPGEKRYMSPMQLVLVAAAGCTAIDVLETLRKMRQEVEGIEVEAIGRRAESPPKTYEDVKIIYRVVGRGLDREKVERAVRLSLEKYCSVGITLKRAGARIDYEIEIRPPSKL